MQSIKFVDFNKNFQEYVDQLNKKLKTGIVTEHSYRPALQNFIESICPKFDAINEPKAQQCGAPDFIIQKSQIPYGHFEAKDIGVNLTAIEKTDQLKRYLAALENLVLTDYVEFRWYDRSQLKLTVKIGNVLKNKIHVEQSNIKKFESLLRKFFESDRPIVKTPKELADMLAEKARLFYSSLTNSFLIEDDDGYFHIRFKALKESIFPHITEEKFLDLYTQTVCYGLFVARCSLPELKDFNRKNAVVCLPDADTFLKNLFTEVSGQKLDKSITWIVDDLAELLAKSDISKIIENFGKSNGGKDPVIYFYEEFLSHYNPKLRIDRGDFYTPIQVVSYIVSSVNELLSSSLKKPDGFADSQIQVLDPAVGTGTFLYSLVELLHNKFKKQGKSGKWNKYVKKTLLKQLFGFEILMAPYAIAHLKLSMQLQKYGYKFGDDERLGIYLCNTLAEPVQAYHTPFTPWISAEGNAANEIKKKAPIMVVMGNPPYKKISETRTPWADKLLEEYRKVDGQPLKEKKSWLTDDYLKFFRFGQWRIEKTGSGILALITNHGFLDNVTLRGMRQSLLKTFDQIFILNLHGNYQKSEVNPNGGKDENVFDGIKQGVSIGIFVKTTNQNEQTKKINYSDLWGERDQKYNFLEKHNVSNTKWETLKPSGPNYYFVPKDWTFIKEYDGGWSLEDIFLEYESGFTTSRDKFAIDYDKTSLENRFVEYLNSSNSDQYLLEKYPDVGKNFDILETRRKLKGLTSWKSSIKKCLYRPFDVRNIFYLYPIVHRPRKIQKHLLQPNLALLANRPQSPTTEFSFIFCSDKINDQCACGNKSIGAGNTYTFPLYLYMGSTPKKLNIDPDFISDLEKSLGLKSETFLKKFSPEDIIYYIYSILHSPTYRKKYSEFLKIAFPKIPLIDEINLFKKLIKNGKKLIELHLLTHPSLKNTITKYPVKGTDEVAIHFPKYNESKKRVYINGDQYFEKITSEIWNFEIGGYQICENWLKQRGGILSSKNINTYQMIVVAILETIKTMKEIDQQIPKWPLSKISKSNKQKSLFHFT